jgi:cAMP-dependent protein kinase regulator
MTDSHAADVQAELQQYLNSKNINSLFIQIVESLLIEKPANPIAFIIEYLKKQYPDQARAAFEGTNAFSDAKPISTGGGAGNKPNHKASKNDDSEEEEEENDDDGVGNMVAAAPKAPVVPKSRRVSVSAESVDPNKMKAQMSQVANIPKSPEVTSRLLQVVSKSPLLRTLDEKQKSAIVNAFNGPITKNPGDNIIVQGEIGDVFYLLEEGNVDVYISKKGQPETKVHTYTPGNAFGELAIMYNAPRAATCRAQTSCRLWALDRVSFKVIVVAAAMIKRETYMGFLKRVPLLEQLTEMELSTLADSLAEETFNDGDTVFRQGDDGDYFYIIKDGVAVCSQRDATGQSKIVATLRSGDYFGEIALLTSKPRQATVTSQGHLQALSLDRATFIRVMGPLDDILKRNMESYSKYSSDL